MGATGGGDGLCRNKWLFRRKLLDRSSLDETKLDRCLNAFDLTALGVGSTLGVGIYVLAGAVAKETAGPSVVLSFLVAGLASALSGLCYAELGARVPRAGSAYVYAYTTVGELVAFVIGWNLILEYVIGTASVARGYSGYLDSMLSKVMQNTYREYLPIDVPFLSPYPDLTALTLTLVLTCVLAAGVKESTRFNNVFTALNLCVVLFVTVAGLLNADLRNWALTRDQFPTEIDGRATDPQEQFGRGGFFPFGVSGMLAGAATCFYGYVGFDAIATSGEEAKNPQTSIPISICLSLFIVFFGYFGISSALTLMVPYYLQDPDAPLPRAFHYVGWNFAGHVVTVGALFGLSTSLLGALFPLPRVIYAMASDGLVFRWFALVSPTFQTPVRATVVAGTFAGLMAALFDLKSLVDMMSIGTLLAYTIVSASVLLLRYQDVPGLSSASGGGEYMALGTLSDAEADLLHGGIPEEEEGPGGGESQDEDSRMVYSRPSIERPGGLPGAVPVSLAEEDEDDVDPHQQQPVFGGWGSFLGGLFNAERKESPSPRSEAITSVLTCAYVGMAGLLALILNVANLNDGGGGGGSGIVVQVLAGILAFSMTACLLCLSLQPKTTQHMAFKVPLVPLLPALSILINLYLMLKLSSATWVRFGVWMLVGFAIYFGYGCRNSSEEHRWQGRNISKAPSAQLIETKMIEK